MPPGGLSGSIVSLEGGQGKKRKRKGVQASIGGKRVRGKKRRRGRDSRPCCSTPFALPGQRGGEGIDVGKGRGGGGRERKLVATSYFNHRTLSKEKEIQEGRKRGKKGRRRAVRTTLFD